MRERTGVALAPPPVVWPPDDTEESVLGTSLHQAAIRTLIGGINEAAAMATPDGRSPHWLAGGQTMIRDFRRRDGSPYTTLPDVFVYLHGWDDARRSLSLTEDGPPALIIEVLSEETYRSDLDLARGKGYSYVQAGVREYLTLDPNYSYVPDGGRGWWLADGAYRPWQRDATGRWASAVLPLAFGLEGARAAVYAADGHRLLREGEVERALLERDQRLHSEIQERQRAEALADQERRRREELARLEQGHAEELARLRRRLEELERGQ